MRVSTTVLNFESWSDTASCLSALRTSTHRRQWITVVDNGSVMEPTPQQREHLVGCTLVQTGENLGYAGGNNVGLRIGLQRGAELLLVVNPDLRVEHDTVAQLVRAMVELPGAGIVGPRIFNGGSRPRTVWFNGADVDPDTGATRVRDLGVEADQCADHRTTLTDYVTGACMLIRREVLEEIGLIPEEYFLYFEETDFNLRAREAGWTCHVVGAARAHHYKASAGRLPSPSYVYYFIRGRLLLASSMGRDAGFESAMDDLRLFINGWRSRIDKIDPSWLGTYQELVDLAVADGRSGRGGRRDDLPS